MKKKIKYSIILPVFNEEKSLEKLTQRLVKVLNSLKDNYEIIFIDDGSSDKSLTIIKKIIHRILRLKLFPLGKILVNLPL